MMSHSINISDIATKVVPLTLVPPNLTIPKRQSLASWNNGNGTSFFNSGTKVKMTIMTTYWTVLNSDI